MVRAPLNRPAVLLAGQTRMPSRVLDLSRGGCRVLIDDGSAVPEGAVELQVTLAGALGGPLRTSCG